MIPLMFILFWVMAIAQQAIGKRRYLHRTRDDSGMNWGAGTGVDGAQSTFDGHLPPRFRWSSWPAMIPDLTEEISAVAGITDHLVASAVEFPVWRWQLKE